MVQCKPSMPSCSEIWSVGVVPFAGKIVAFAGKIVPFADNMSR